MASNTTLNPGASGDIYASKEISHDGDTAKVQLIQRVGIDGTEGSYTATAESKDAVANLNTAHDAADAGNPMKIGARAVAHGSNPTGVVGGDRTHMVANVAGVPFVIGGHPNVKTATYIRTDAATDDNVLPAISAGTKYVITRLSVFLDQACTVAVSARLGFGASTVPALGSTGADAVDGILASHPGMVPGSGFQIGDGSGILGVGGDGEELRITNSAPTGGALHVSVSYYTIES